MRSIHGVISVSAAVVVLTFSGCASSASTGATPTAAGSPTSDATAPLDCDAVAPAALVTTALTGADGAAPNPVAAVKPSEGLIALELAAAGGLNCSWRTGPAPETVYAGAGETAYLSVRVLPGAAAQYRPVWAGDTPSTETRDVGGVTVSSSFGEVGWQLGAPVGDAWVEIRLAAPGLGTVGSPFDGLDPDTVFDRLTDLAAPVFDTITAASPEQLAWPKSAKLRSGEARCAGGLDPQGIGSALQANSVEVTLDDPTLDAPSDFADAAASAARAFTCDYSIDGLLGPQVTLVTGAGEQFDALLQADLATAFETLDLSSSPSFADGDRAVRAKVTDGPASPVFLDVGGLVYEVVSYDGATAVATAILEQIR